MKLVKKVLLISGVSMVVIGIGFFMLITSVISAIFGGEDNISSGIGENVSLSPEVERYRSTMEDYAREYEIGDFVNVLLAIMEQESHGALPDCMQSSESPFNTTGGPITDPEYSIECGVRAFKDALDTAGCTSPTETDLLKASLQGYNFGSGYITWAFQNYGGYSKENAVIYSDMMKTQTGYAMYGDVNYVDNVLRYYSEGSGNSNIGTGSGGNVSYPETGIPIPLYHQADYPHITIPSWGGTILSSGCGYTSLAMVVSYLTGETITPDKIVAFTGGNYHSDQGILWQAFIDVPAHYGITPVIQTTDKNTIMSALANGQPVINSQGIGFFTSFGHIMVLRGVTKNGKILINDPADNAQKNYFMKEFTFEQINAAAKNYWIYPNKETVDSAKKGKGNEQKK